MKFFRVFRKKPKVVGHSTLAAVVTIGNEESARQWERQLGRPEGTLAAGDQIDLGVISRGDITFKPEASHG